MVAGEYSCGSTKAPSRPTWVLTVFTILLLMTAGTLATAFEPFGTPGAYARADGSCGFDQSMGSADTSIYGAITIPNRADGQFHEIAVDSGSVFGITTSGRHKYPARGGWAGISQRISLGSSLDLGLEGWAQIPSKQRCFSDYEFVGSDKRFQRIWSRADSMWWYADAALYFCVGSWMEKCRMVPNSRPALRLLFQTHEGSWAFSGFVHPIPFKPIRHIGTDGNWVTPYLGIEYRSDTGLTVMTLRFLSAPFALGTLQHEENWLGADPTGRKDEASFTFKNSWFFEGYCEGLCNVTKDSAVGGFVKMTHIDATSKSNFKSTLGSGVHESADSTLVFRRLGYAFGAKVDFRFALPF